MARKKSFLGTVVKLGGIAAACTVAYKNREQIKSFLNEAAERVFADKEPDIEPDVYVDEADVVIDGTTKEVTEETEEA